MASPLPRSVVGGGSARTSVGSSGRASTVAPKSVDSSPASIRASKGSAAVALMEMPLMELLRCRFSF